MQASSQHTMSDIINVDQDPSYEPAGSGVSRTQDGDTVSINSDSPSATSQLRQRSGTGSTTHRLMDDVVDGFVMVGPPPENEIEAQKLYQNYMFGYKKWKSHVTSRPLSQRSSVVRELYAEPKSVKKSVTSTISVGNLIYCFLIGWWVALVYLLVALIMLLTIIGRKHAMFCLKFAGYFFWPFGKFVQEYTEYTSIISNHVTNSGSKQSSGSENLTETSPLVISESYSDIDTKFVKTKNGNYWRRVDTYFWLVLGVPILVIVHSLVFLVTWLLVVFIPIAKVNSIAIKKILFLPPEKVRIDKTSMNGDGPHAEVVVCTYQAVNVYYYKYTVDGMNVILVNLLVFVVVALLYGYLDHADTPQSSNVKFILSLLAIIPLAYYIGMAIASIAAQSTFAVGAVLNATFGSIVEIVLYITALLHGKQGDDHCYSELVKAALTGTILATLLFIPGLCMILGGLKHHEQRFNWRSAGVSSALLFVCIAGAFAPTMFSKAYGILICSGCDAVANHTVLDNDTEFICTQCRSQPFDHNSEMFTQHIEPLIYTCTALLPLAYIVGLIYTLKTHKHIHRIPIEPIKPQESDNALPQAQSHHHGVAHWSRLKSFIILMVSTILMSLCAELVTDNIQEILVNSKVSIYFIGVTLLALVPDIPEIVNGIQFALQNNMTLSIEVGCSIAVQVCLIQMPVLVIVNAIHPIDFVLVFNDLHLWSVVLSVVLVNYIFMDGKCDYFQGSTLVIVYLILIAMYYFAPSPTGC
ncbi:uncharacterized protein [Ptychodera flava]|uniref:uncharacterized protein n=1 Tax=Ptychodera flava TaxID=63121 RepID=UPI00396A6D6A